MRTKPWPFIVLAALNFLCALGNLFISSHFEKLSLTEYLKLSLKSSSPWMDLFFLLICPWLAAWAIFVVKRWSYPVFFSVMLCEMGDLVYEAHHFPEYLSLRLAIIFTFLNFLLVSYFFIPKVRKLYFDQKLKWWEHAPRFEVAVYCLVERLEEASIPSEILNISEGGAFLHSPQPLRQDDEIKIVFEKIHELPTVHAKVVHVRAEGGFGIQFLFLGDQTKRKQIKKFLKHLRRQGATVRTGRLTLKDFIHWLKTKAYKWTGWIPDL